MSEVELSSDHPSGTPPPPRRQRNLPGNPDPDAEVIALSPRTLMATNRFVCEICNKGFQRDQNLQLHRRGHNLPWKLRQRTPNEVVRRRVYVCPQIGCVHHNPSRALGDLTGIKKHFCRKHGEKTFRCERCSRAYAVESDRKAHMKTCGSKEYVCECDASFTRRDSFMTHKAYCDTVSSQEGMRPQRHFQTVDLPPPPPFTQQSRGVFLPVLSIQTSGENQAYSMHPSPTSASGSSVSNGHNLMSQKGVFPSIYNAAPSPSHSSLLRSGADPVSLSLNTPTFCQSQNPRPSYAQPALSATALLQKAAQMGSTSSTSSLLNGLWPPHSVANNSMASGLGSSSSYNRALMMSDSELFGDKPATVDFLGLEMGGGEGSSRRGGFTAFLNSIADMGPPPSYGGQDPTKRKH